MTSFILTALAKAITYHAGLSMSSTTPCKDAIARPAARPPLWLPVAVSSVGISSIGPSVKPYRCSKYANSSLTSGGSSDTVTDSTQLMAATSGAFALYSPPISLLFVEPQGKVAHGSARCFIFAA